MVRAQELINRLVRKPPANPVSGCAISIRFPNTFGSSKFYLNLWNQTIRKMAAENSVRHKKVLSYPMITKKATAYR